MRFVCVCFFTYSSIHLYFSHSTRTHTYSLCRCENEAEQLPRRGKMACVSCHCFGGGRMQNVTVTPLQNMNTHRIKFKCEFFKYFPFVCCSLKIPLFIVAYAKHHHPSKSHLMQLNSAQMWQMQIRCIWNILSVVEQRQRIKSKIHAIVPFLCQLTVLPRHAYEARAEWKYSSREFTHLNNYRWQFWLGIR